MKHTIITIFLACSCAFLPIASQAFFDEPVSDTTEVYSDIAAENLQANIFTETDKTSISSDQNHWGYFLLFVLALSIVLPQRRRRVAIPWKRVVE